jgi:hypothetical protein
MIRQYWAPRRRGGYDLARPPLHVITLDVIRHAKLGCIQVVAFLERDTPRPGKEYSDNSKDVGRTDCDRRQSLDSHPCRFCRKPVPPHRTPFATEIVDPRAFCDLAGGLLVEQQKEANEAAGKFAAIVPPAAPIFTLD